MTPGPTITTCAVCERNFDTGLAVDPMAAYTCGDCLDARADRGAVASAVPSSDPGAYLRGVYEGSLEDDEIDDW